MTTTSQYVYTPDGELGVIELPASHPILTMTDDERARAVDDPYWQHLATVIYESVFGAWT